MARPLKSLRLPDDPTLAAWASALNDAGFWAQIVDANWRYVFVTDELSVSYQALGLPAVPVGAHLLSAEGVQYVLAELGGSWPSPAVRRAWFLTAGRYVTASTPGGREELRRLVDPELADLVDELQTLAHPVVSVMAPLLERAAAFGDVAAGSMGSARTGTSQRQRSCFGSMTLTDTLRVLRGDQTRGGDVAARRRGRDRGLGASRTDAGR